jgi:hypothetical protein
VKQSDLSSGLKRLYSGFSRTENDLTPERLTALFGIIGCYSAESWEAACTRLLCETRFPDFDAIHATIDSCAEDLRLKEVRHADEDAKRFLSGSLNPAHFPSPSDHDYGRFRIKILLAIADGATPNDVAAMLESQAAKYDEYGLAGEARRYRSMGGSWAQPGATWWDKRQAEDKASRNIEEIKASKRILSFTGPAPDEAWAGWRKTTTYQIQPSPSPRN